MNEDVSDGWAASAAAWIVEQGQDGDYGRRFVLDAPMKERIEGRGFRNALDVGCGEGRFCRIMQRAGIRTTGIDPTEALLARARELDPDGDYRLGRQAAVPSRSPVIAACPSFTSWSGRSRPEGKVGYFGGDASLVHWLATWLEARPMISCRPPVLAHERFLADRENFAGLDLAARFERIERTNLWGAATSVCGLGSEDPATAAIREALPALLRRLRVRSLLDAPCGDAGWIGRLGLDVDYTGIDIVPSLIEANCRRVADGASPGRFLVADITRDALPLADLILCRDCLVHLSFANIDRALAQFRMSGARFLLVTTFPEWDGNRDGEDGDWRALNMEKAPFNWPAPDALINERCEEGGGGWSDKSLGLWRLDQLPNAKPDRAARIAAL